MSVTQISRSAGRELKSAPGFVLRTDAAIALDNACKVFGKNLILTGAWRSYETQRRIFLERYEAGAYSPYGDYRRWRGVQYGRVRGAAAAVPGTSNHGGGVAIDVKTRREAGDPPREKAVVFVGWSDSDREAFLKAAAKFGWRDDEGERVGEHWHITYYPQYDQYRGKVIGAPTAKPKPSAPKKRKPHAIATISDHHEHDDDWRTRLWQEFLKATGDYSGAIDGDFGRKTDTATKRWQKRAGLEPDGVVGEHTWYRACQGVEPGDRGVRVKIAQRMLGFTGKAVDGVAGKNYTTRCKEVQRWLGVEADAKIGPGTTAALLKKG